MIKKHRMEEMQQKAKACKSVAPPYKKTKNKTNTHTHNYKTRQVRRPNKQRINKDKYVSVVNLPAN